MKRDRVSKTPSCGTVVVGGGPAAIAFLLAAAREGDLPDLLDYGLTIIERDASLGCGALGGYAVVSDSTAATFLSSVRGHPVAALAALAAGPEAAALAAHGEGSGVPLREAGAFLAAVGGALAKLITRGGGRMLTGHEAFEARRAPPGGWTLCLRRRGDGATLAIEARNVIIATGGEQRFERLAAEKVAGRLLGALCGDRLVRSEDVLATGGAAQLARRLAGVERPRIAIVGSSTSAVTSACVILASEIGAKLNAGGLTLLHNRPLRPFYPSAAAALADGFTEFDRNDVCPLSGFVYRLAGFRTEARDLVLASLGVSGRQPDPRLRLHRRDGEGDEETLRLLAEADVVVAALGYRPRALPLRDAFGAPIPLAAEAPGAPPMVDRACRVLDSRGMPLEGVYGIGLAAGFTPSKEFGGEPSFRGQANGWWLWQSAVGAAIVDQLRVSRDAIRRPMPCRAAPCSGARAHDAEAA